MNSRRQSNHPLKGNLWNSVADFIYLSPLCVCVGAGGGWGLLHKLCLWNTLLYFSGRQHMPTYMYGCLHRLRHVCIYIYIYIHMHICEHNHCACQQSGCPSCWALASM